jgi:hypothetical protein
VLLHTNAVAKKGAPRKWACRIDGQDTNARFFGAINRRQAVYKRALAGPTGPRNADNWLPTGKWEQLPYQIRTATVLYCSNRLCQGTAITGHEPVNYRVNVRAGFRFSH